MKNVKCLDRNENIQRGMYALYKEFGPVETRRFMSFTHPLKREDSVTRHRKWQDSVDPEEFIKEMRTAYKQTGKK